MMLTQSMPMLSARALPTESLFSRTAARTPAADATPDISVLYCTYRPTVFRIALRLLADPNDAEDAVQDIFLKLHCHPALYDPALGLFDHWVARVTRNYCLDVLRQKAHSVRRTVQVHSLWETDDMRLLSVEEEVWCAQRARALHAAAATLKEKHRQLLQLAYGGGMSHSQIARVTGLPLGTVKTRMREATQQLRVLLAHNAVFAECPADGAAVSGVPRE